MMSAACALCLAASLSVPALAAGAFTDVQETAWYAQAVEAMSAQGHMTGTGDGIFTPDGTVSRATVLTALWRMEGAPPIVVPATFSDVPPDAWYTGAVAWAQHQKIASGDDKGRFSPESPVTREQLAVFLYQYALFKKQEITSGVLELYSDGGAVSKWAQTAMKHAVGAGILKGSAGKLNPGGPTTRAELAVILQRLLIPAMG